MLREVSRILDQSVKIVGNRKSSVFRSDNYCYLQENPVDSPLEQILYIAFELVREVMDMPLVEPGLFNDEDIFVGLGLRPQYVISKYRVDFLAIYGRIHRNIYEYEEVVIECDSQLFHDRTESERRYEKQRDRFLQKNGYKVFHYTGKEIMDHPYKVAAEIIGYLIHADPLEVLFDVEACGQ